MHIPLDRVAALVARVTAILHARPRLVFACLVTLALTIWTTVGASAVFVYSALSGLPDSAALQTVGAMAHSTTVVDVKGRHAFTIFQEQRLHVPLARMSPHLIRAIVDTEDQRFYEHGGVDVVRVLGAGLNNVLSGRAEQGGSTITQQLARLTFLTPDKTFRRKLQEVIVATRLEQAFTKDQILELYLNKAYFGDGLYGVEAASLGYFGTHATDLDVPSAALIAGLLKSPSTYAPTASAERAVARRNLVLRVMHDAGSIDGDTYETARTRPLVLNDALRGEEAYGQYFKEEIRQQLVEWFGWDRVHHEGLRVETTLDLDLQKAAEAEVARALAEIEQRQGRRARQLALTDPLQAALVALDPHTGEVRALVGGRAFDQSKFNRVTQAKRQPGSAFKPFVYAAALEQGFTPATILRGLAEPVVTRTGAWAPEDDHLEDDALTVRAALRTSSNRAAVRMLEDVGIPAAVEYAQLFGMGSMPQVPSLALGSGEVTMLSLVSAYGAFANEGMMAAPTLIRRVTTSTGDVLYESKPATRQVLRPATAYLITSMLEDVIDAGTAAQVRGLGFRLPAAGKTGTTNDYRDAWFIGYTSNLVTGVWVGHDQPRTIVQGGYAAQLVVPLWTRFMITATRGQAAVRFRAPSSVTAVAICSLSGKLATDSCRRNGEASVYTEYFEHGTEPNGYCPHHLFRAAPVTVASAAIASVPDDVVAPAPVVARATTAPAPPAAVSTPAAPPEAPKKRGFWGRIFRGGR